MKTIKRFMAGTLGATVLLIQGLPVYGQAVSDQTMIRASLDAGLESVENTANIISDSIDSLTIESTDSTAVYEPEYTPVYTYSEPYVEIQDTSTTMSVDEFLALHGQQEETKTIVETVPVDTSNQEETYQAALVGYNAALAEFEAANQMIETTKEIEVEIIEEVTDEEGSVTEVKRTEIQTVTEMVPAGDIVSAQANLDAAKAALDNAQMALDAARNSTAVVETVQENVEPVVNNDTQEEQSLIDEDVIVEEEQTYASSGTCGDNVSWALDAYGTLNIFGNGYMYDFSDDNLPAWGKNVKSIVIREGVKSIGAQAFSYCENLTSVTIPYGVLSIGKGAFYDCKSLRNIDIPDSVIVIDEFAFWLCTSLEYINIPPSVTKIGQAAFYQCESLTRVAMPNVIQELPPGLFKGCKSLPLIVIPNSITCIHEIVFEGCSSLGGIILPDSVTMIKARAFNECPNLKYIFYSGTHESWAKILVQQTDEYPTFNKDIQLYCIEHLVESVSSVNLSPGTKTLTIGDSFDLKATVYPSNATLQTVTWSSSDNSIAEVSDNGKVTALKEGRTIITAETNDGGYTDTCIITVVKPSVIPVTSVSLSENSKILAVGNTFNLIATISPSNATNKNVTWSSSNTSVATVSSSGLVKGVGPGTAVITVTTADGSKSAKCTITVKSPVTGVSLNKTSAYIDLDNSLQLTATVSPSNATNKIVTWSSSNTSVATVSSSGLVKGVGPGTAVITVTTVDGGKSAKCTITVSNVKTGKCGENLYWKLTGEDLYIYGTGDMYNYTWLFGSNPSPWGQNIKTVKIDSGVTSIGECAFYHCQLEHIDIANTVKEIRYDAFSGCDSLTSIEIPDGATSIGSFAFAFSDGLTTVKIPNSVTSIVNDAFSDCTKLSDIYYQGTKTDWNNKNLYSFDSTVTVHFLGDNLPFKDVYTDDWYYSVAKECYETGLINGTSATTFSPMQTMTRAMVVTILWRMDGQPKVAFNNKFKDVTSSQWYATSISWAEKSGVVHGYGDGTFKPDAAVTREQVAVMLANYAQYKKVYKPGTVDYSTYPDGNQVSGYAQQGMKWALTNGIISGNGAGYLNPKKSATRAEGAAMLLRMKNWL